MKKFLLYFLILLLIAILLMKVIAGGIIHHYQLQDADTAAFIVSATCKLLLLSGFYLAFRKEAFFDEKKVFNNNVGVFIVVGILLFLSLRFSLPYVGTLYSWENLAAYYAHCFSVGFSEEVLCRWIIFGLVVAASPQRSAFAQIVIASVIFAFLHIGNLITGSMDILSVLNQIMYAFLMGLFFQGLFVRYRNIILVAVLHALANFHGMYNATFKPDDSSMAEAYSMADVFQTQLIFGIAGIFMLLVLRLTMKTKDVKRLYAV
ncbi:CAAX amino terminal protease self- immunity [compost metagenome]